jgi:hypothetical protein
MSPAYCLMYTSPVKAHAIFPNASPFSYSDMFCSTENRAQSTSPSPSALRCLVMFAFLNVLCLAVLC